ncbi:ATP-binding cassette subfamily G member 4-like isoform X2 [Ornithodoros turicata]|uniref:ATP-binding cassette subfamily G member 4-like isoform X2 n=1 Tax=Ornithodoros turicata TaxID=34597 RepID=UPI003139DF70
MEWRKTLLHNLSGRATPSTLTVIMGPSGAGKTTLLNVLTGFFEKGYDGEVQINGYVRVPDLFNKQSCYVMQDEHLLPVLTVREALTMSGELRMPSATSEERTAVVSKAIEEWNLHDCERVRTCDISGGQRKRLAIAQELVNNPPVIFLDEPTTGLDSVTSLLVVQILRRLAKEGHTVICSVHTPSAKIFSHFDNLYMLSQGMCIYNGPVKDLVEFTSRHNLHCPQYHNPADFICEISAGEHGDCIPELAKEFTIAPPEKTCGDRGKITPYGGQTMSDSDLAEARRQYSFKINHTHQFAVLMKRCWLAAARNKMATPFRYLIYALFGSTIAAIFYDVGNKASTTISNLSMIFLCCCIVVFQSLMPTVMVFPTEITVLLREHRNCWYSLRMYYLAKYIVEVVPCVLPVLLMVGITYYPTSQPLVFWRAAAFCLLCIQLSSVTQSIGLLVSALSSVQMAVFLAFPAMSPAFFFSGFYVQSNVVTPYLRWIHYASPIYHAYQGIILSTYGYGREKLECDDFICLYEDPADVLEFTNSAEKKLYLQIVILVSLEVVFRVIAFVALKWRLKRKT